LRKFRHLPSGIWGWLLLHILLTSKLISWHLFIEGYGFLIWLSCSSCWSNLYFSLNTTRYFCNTFLKPYTKWVFAYATNYMQENKFCVVKDSNPTKMEIQTFWWHTKSHNTYINILISKIDLWRYSSISSSPNNGWGKIYLTSAVILHQVVSEHFNIPT
jgi:hypothetical protein